MGKYNIQIIALAVFSIVLLLGYDYQNAYADFILMSVIANTGAFLDGTNNRQKMIGERFTASSALIGIGFDSLTIQMRHGTSATCSLVPCLIRIGVWDGSVNPTATNFKRLFGIVDYESLNPTFTNFTFNFNDDYTIASGDVIGAYFDGTGVHDAIVGYDSTAPFDGSNTLWTCFGQTGSSCNGVWSNDSTRDLALTLRLISAEQGNQQDGFCGLGTLRDCMGSSNALSGLVPANQNITSVGTIIGQGIGVINPDDDNPRTNGVGLFYMLITGTFFAIALMTTVHTLNMRGFISASVKEIDPIFWLFLVVGTVSVAWYLDWIDDIIFAAMTVGLAGLVAFGVLKHFGRI